MPSDADQLTQPLWITAQQFSRNVAITAIEPLGNGNINDTYLVRLLNPAASFVLQRINPQVFQQPELVMGNLRVYYDHVQRRLPTFCLAPGRRWEVPQILLTGDQQDYWIDSQGDCWRGISFIENAITFDTIQSTAHGQEVGQALGTFHALVSDLPINKLVDTLPGFHITPQYLADYNAVLPDSSRPLSAERQFCTEFIHQRQFVAATLETAKANQQLPVRVMHGDPKVNNILCDLNNSHAIGLIDLDTVKPGLIHYDVGDCLRSGCNLQGEEAQNWEAVTFDIDVCQAILSGYLTISQHFLRASEYPYFYDAIRLIAFELGLRFFTDYLANDIYFKTTYPEQNLLRALVQFKLTASVEAQADKIRILIEDLK